MTTWQASIVFCCIIIFAVGAQQGFAHIQHIMEDEMWVRVTELSSSMACIMMLDFGTDEYQGTLSEGPRAYANGTHSHSRYT